MKRLRGPYAPLLAAVAGLAIVVALYWLTVHENQEDPCADPQGDVTAAILADGDDAADALANRAILQRGACDPGAR